MMASSSSSNGVSVANLTKQMRSHEVAIAELDNLPSSRSVYLRNGYLFFRTTIPKATAFEQKQLDSDKAKLKFLNSSS